MLYHQATSNSYNIRTLICVVSVSAFPLMFLYYQHLRLKLLFQLPFFIIF